jgi:hypothetical protein
LPYQVHKHEDYVEVRLEGVIEAAIRLSRDESSEAQSRGKLLFDYSGVTEMKADAYELAEAARFCEANGLKVAVFAPRPALFGLARQSLQLANVKEGVSANVFSDHDEARAWLISA